MNSEEVINERSGRKISTYRRPCETAWWRSKPSPWSSPIPNIITTPCLTQFRLKVSHDLDGVDLSWALCAEQWVCCLWQQLCNSRLIMTLRPHQNCLLGFFGTELRPIPRERPAFNIYRLIHLLQVFVWYGISRLVSPQNQDQNCYTWMTVLLRLQPPWCREPFPDPLFNSSTFNIKEHMVSAVINGGLPTHTCVQNFK